MEYGGVSKNSGTPKSSILIGFSIINHPLWVPLFLETPMDDYSYCFKKNVDFLPLPLGYRLPALIIWRKLMR